MPADEPPSGASKAASARRTVTAAELNALVAAKPVEGAFVLESLELAQGAGLAGLQAADVTFKNCDFSGVNATGATFAGVTFDDCLFQQTILDGANMVGARFTKGSLHAAKMRDAHADGAKFLGATMTEVDATGADFRNADFGGSSLQDAILDLADLRGARNFLFDQTRTRGIRLLLGGDDQWSVLRRVYTGPRLLLNLLPVFVFVITLAGKSYALYILALLQTRPAPQLGIAGYCSQAGASCETRTVLEVLIGIGEGPWAVGFVLFALAYNALRFLLTMTVARLRDEEGRSGTTPPYGIDWAGFRQRVGRAIKNKTPGEDSWASALYAACLEPMGSYRIPYYAHRILVLGQYLMYALFARSLYGILTAEITLPG
jgi:hypothetical protein